MNYLKYMGLGLVILSKPLFADEIPNNACGGRYALLALVDRPTEGDSVCTVPYQSVLLENGFEYQTLVSQGEQKNYPEAVFRIGLPHHTEAVLVLPNHINQSQMPTGATATTVGIKHMILANSRLMTSLENLVTLPSGSDAFGSRGFGEAFNGIVAYNLTPRIGITGMFGVSSMTQSSQSGGRRYTSFNPDLVLTWSKDSLQWYGEIYGQSKTDPHEGAGFNVDAGVIYLLSPLIEVDVEVGHRINGMLGGFENYVGAGISLFSGN